MTALLVRCACGLEARAEGGFVSDLMASSGFHAILCGGGGISWLCPEHHASALRAAAELVRLTGSVYAVPPGLRPKEGDI